MDVSFDQYLPPPFLYHYKRRNPSSTYPFFRPLNASGLYALFPLLFPFCCFSDFSENLSVARFMRIWTLFFYFPFPCFACGTSSYFPPILTTNSRSPPYTYMVELPPHLQIKMFSSPPIQIFPFDDDLGNYLDSTLRLFSLFILPSRLLLPFFFAFLSSTLLLYYRSILVVLCPSAKSFYALCICLDSPQCVCRPLPFPTRGLCVCFPLANNFSFP